MIYWSNDLTEESSENDNPTQRLVEFTREYKNAMKDAGITLPHISSAFLERYLSGIYDKK